MSTPEDKSGDFSNDQQLLAHVTKRKILPPGNIKHLLSPTAGSQPINQPQSLKKSTQQGEREINLNGTVYRQVNIAKTLYSVSGIQVPASQRCSC
jgi:hypothetical protein